MPPRLVGLCVAVLGGFFEKQVVGFVQTGAKKFWNLTGVGRQFGFAEEALSKRFPVWNRDKEIVKISESFAPLDGNISGLDLVTKL